MLVCHFIGGDVSHDLMHHLPCILFPPILDLPLSLKSICLHYYQVARFQVHCAYLSIIVPFLLACFHHRSGLHLPQGSPQSFSDRSYVFIHMLGGGLSHGGLTAANSGEVKVDWEPRLLSEHQIVWTVPGNCRTGGIIGMHYFSQMRCPVSFFVFSQLPNHLHYHVV